ncbi:unnamed protein product [Gordionus sp. m RMFG-2023]
MSIKSVNTKFGAKMRETWSADAITRELLTEYDFSLIPIERLYEGVTSRRSANEIARIFDRINKYTVGDTYGVICSNDTSGWSPSAPRHHWATHHDYNLRLTSTGKWLSLELILKNIEACIAKRVVLAHALLKDGLFQGWTGMADSIFNVHISTYCVRVGRQAVQGIKFPVGTSEEYAQRATDEHYATTKRVWGELGAELNDAKTIYSSIKFIYLNRFFCQGSEVLCDMKTFSKIDRDYTKRLSTLTQQIDTVFGAARASSERGSDPILCYYYATFRSIDLITQTSAWGRDLSYLKLVALFFAPRSLSGYGFPHFIAFVIKERLHPITMYLGIIHKTKNLCTSPRHKQRLNHIAMQFIGRKLATPTAMSVVNDPMAVRAADVENIESKIYVKLKKKMMSKCKSRVLRQAFELSSSTKTANMMAQSTQNIHSSLSSANLAISLNAGNAIDKWVSNEWLWILDWEPTLPHPHMAILLQNTLFPAMRKELETGLRNKTVPLSTVSDWYMKWKSIFPQSLLDRPDIKSEFESLLMIINNHLTSLENANANSAYNVPKPYYHHEAPYSAPYQFISRASESSIPMMPPPPPPLNLVPQSEHAFSFRELVQAKLERCGIIFGPANLSTMNMYHLNLPANKQIYKVEGNRKACTAYIDRDVLFVSDKSSGFDWMPISVNDLINLVNIL